MPIRWVEIYLYLMERGESSIPRAISPVPSLTTIKADIASNSFNIAQLPRLNGC